MPRQSLRRRTLLAAPALALAMPARAQTRPVRLIVPFAPGGGTDVTTRLWAPKVSEILGQPVVVENPAGAGGVIGVDFVSKQAPTGDVLGMATLSQIGLAPGLPQPLPFDSVKDLAPIAPTVFVPARLVVTRRGLAVNTAQELMAPFRNNPGEVPVRLGRNRHIGPHRLRHIREGHRRGCRACAPSRFRSGVRRACRR